MSPRNRPLFALAVIACALFGVARHAFARPTVTVNASRDGTLYEDSLGQTASGAGPTFFVGSTNGQQRRRGLLFFDVAASVPSGSIVTAATLTLNMSRTVSGAQPVSLHLASRAWGEGASVAGGAGGGGAQALAGDATWLHTFFPGSFWTNQGGDFAPGSSATTSVAGVGSYSWSGASLRSDVAGWLASPATNFGWVVLGDESTKGTAKRFDTRENPTAGNRPRLVVTYRPPCPGDINGDAVVDFSDLNLVLSGFGSVYSFADLNQVLSAFGSACPGV